MASVGPDEEGDEEEITGFPLLQQTFSGRNWQTYGSLVPQQDWQGGGSMINYLTTTTNTSGPAFVSSPDLGATTYTNAASLLSK